MFEKTRNLLNYLVLRWKSQGGKPSLEEDAASALAELDRAEQSLPPHCPGCTDPRGGTHSMGTVEHPTQGAVARFEEAAKGWEGLKLDGLSHQPTQWYLDNSGITVIRLARAAILELLGQLHGARVAKQAERARAIEDVAKWLKQHPSYGFTDDAARAIRHHFKPKGT